MTAYKFKKFSSKNRQKKWCREMESNHRHEALQASALPLSYPGTYKILRKNIFNVP